MLSRIARAKCAWVWDQEKPTHAPRISGLDGQMRPPRCGENSKPSEPDRRACGQIDHLRVQILVEAAGSAPLRCCRTDPGTSAGQCRRRRCTPADSTVRGSQSAWSAARGWSYPRRTHRCSRPARMRCRPHRRASRRARCRHPGRWRPYRPPRRRSIVPGASPKSAAGPASTWPTTSPDPRSSAASPCPGQSAHRVPPTRCRCRASEKPEKWM